MKPGEPPLEAIDGVEQFPDHIVKLVDEIVKLNLMESNELARCLQVAACRLSLCMYAFV